MPTRKVSQEAHQNRTPPDASEMQSAPVENHRAHRPPIEKVTPTPTVPRTLRTKAAFEQVIHFPFGPGASQRLGPRTVCTFDGLMACR